MPGAVVSITQRVQVRISTGIIFLIDGKQPLELAVLWIVDEHGAVPPDVDEHAAGGYRGCSRAHGFAKVLEGARAATGDHRHVDRGRDAPDELQVEALLRAVAIDG